MTKGGLRLVSDGEGILVHNGGLRVLFLNDPKVHSAQNSFKGTLVVGRRPILGAADAYLFSKDLRILGAVELRFQGSRLRLESSGLRVGQRPWNPYGKQIEIYQKKLALFR